ncbi:hypothetical protein J2Z76_002103 [Sedimentibacter acidaminivorans]|uniref:Type II secretion system protein n=1 Tax=Sedimentibacter acidaminivorans TaxID=913099 RepID=A0ABS4GEV8_9FIRM|nr:hypothetical protein [Sedimentibacter acidaminivorans]MBP1926238.1 hypothetical protein [Sedimentibacter acidaminivorans]
MKGKSSISLEVSLVEIILSVLIFAITGIIMLNCFAMARYTQIKSNDITIASLKSQTFLEYIKSSKNNNEMNEIIKKMFDEIYYDNSSSKYVNYYDKNWNKCDDKNRIYFIELYISTSELNSGELNDIKINIGRIKKYPFIDKKNSSSSIFVIETKKFFPINIIRGKQDV